MNYIKFGVIALLLASLIISVQAQTQSVRVVCQPGINADSVRTQYSLSPIFATILGQSIYKKTVAGKTDTCDCSVPKVEGTTYYFRCESKNPADSCIASPLSVVIPIPPPSGCATLSVQLIP